MTAKVGSTIGAEIKFGSSVAVGLAGLVWRMYDVILLCFSLEILACVLPLFSRFMMHKFSSTLDSCHYKH